MHKHFITFIFIFLLLLGLVGCPNNPDEPSGKTNNDTTKIASLQAQINSAETGDTVDLKNAVIENGSLMINKQITLANADFNGGSLTVASDGVVLNGIKNASVATNNSMKISGSSLSGLTIGNSSRSDENTIPAAVEIAGSTMNQITVSLANAILSLSGKTTASEITATSAVTIAVDGTDAKVASISASVAVTVVLENNAFIEAESDNVTKITMPNNAEPEEIAVKGMPTSFYSDQIPNFSSVSVIGTYTIIQDEDEIVIMKPIKNYKIYLSDEQRTVYYENGQTKSTTKLSAGSYSFVVEAIPITERFTVTVKEKNSGNTVSTSTTSTSTTLPPSDPTPIEEPSDNINWHSVSVADLSTDLATFDSTTDIYYIAITDASPDFAEIKAAIVAHPSVKIALNLSGCSDMRSVPVEALSGCSNLTDVRLSENVITIEDAAFLSCSNLTNVSILGVTTLGIEVFYNCTNLTNISLGSAIENITAETFNYSYINEINVSDDNQYLKSVDGVIYSKDGKTIIYYPYAKTGESYEIINGVTVVGEKAFSSQKNLKNIKMPSTTLSIGYAAFSCCYNLTSISFSGNVTSIDKSAFYGCRKLAEIELPSSLGTVGDGAFYHCCNITSLSIPDSVTSIGKGLLDGGRWNSSGNEKLKTITIGSGVPNTISVDEMLWDNSIDYPIREYIKSSAPGNDSIFYNKFAFTTLIIKTNEVMKGGILPSRSITGIYVPDTLVESYKSDDGWSRYASAIHAMSDLDGDKTTTPPDVTCDISELSEKLAQVEYYGEPVTVHITDENPTLTISNAWLGDEYGKYFGNDYMLINLDLSSCVGLTMINSQAFYRCTNIVGITLPNTITIIDSQAFEWCTSLTTVTILANDPPALPSNAFNCNPYSDNGLTTIYVPADSVETYKTANGWSNFASKITAITE